MTLPKSLDEQLYFEVKQQKEAQGMGYITIAERKGIQKGKLEGLRKAIESVLEVKFNTVDADIANHLKKIKSVNKLEELLHLAKLSTTEDEFKEKLGQ